MEIDILLFCILLEELNKINFVFVVFKDSLLIFNQSAISWLTSTWIILFCVLIPIVYFPWSIYYFCNFINKFNDCKFCWPIFSESAYCCSVKILCFSMYMISLLYISFSNNLENKRELIDSFQLVDSFQIYYFHLLWKWVSHFSTLTHISDASTKQLNFPVKRRTSHECMMSRLKSEDMIDSGTNAYLHMSRTKLSRQKYAIKTA